MKNQRPRICIFVAVMIGLWSLLVIRGVAKNANFVSSRKTDESPLAALNAMGLQAFVVDKQPDRLDRASASSTLARESYVAVWLDGSVPPGLPQEISTLKRVSLFLKNVPFSECKCLFGIDGVVGLALEYDELTDVNFEGVAFNDSLSTISMTRVTLNSRSITHLRSLKSLQFHGCEIDADGPSESFEVGEFPTLVELYINCCGIEFTEWLLQQICEFPSLETLSVGHFEGRLSDEVISLVAACPKLRLLRLMWIGVSTEAFLGLCCSPNLSEIHVTEKPIAAEAIYGLGKACPRINVIVYRNTD